MPTTWFRSAGRVRSTAVACSVAVHLCAFALVWYLAGADPFRAGPFSAAGQADSRVVEVSLVAPPQRPSGVSASILPAAPPHVTKQPPKMPTRKPLSKAKALDTMVSVSKSQPKPQSKPQFKPQSRPQSRPQASAASQAVAKRMARPDASQHASVAAPPVESAMASTPVPTAGTAPVPETGPSVVLSYRRRNPPRYPPRAIREHQEGTVMLLVLVGVHGQPLKVQVSTSSGYRELDRAAIEAVRQWRFNPGRRDGIAHEAWARIPVTFALRQG